MTDTKLTIDRECRMPDYAGGTHPQTCMCQSCQDAALSIELIADAEALRAATLRAETYQAKYEVMRERVEKFKAASGAVLDARGRYNSQIAFCRLGELLGREMVWPKKVKRDD